MCKYRRLFSKFDTDEEYGGAVRIVAGVHVAGDVRVREFLIAFLARAVVLNVRAAVLDDDCNWVLRCAFFTRDENYVAVFAGYEINQVAERVVLAALFLQLVCDICSGAKRCRIERLFRFVHQIFFISFLDLNLARPRAVR